MCLQFIINKIHTSVKGTHQHLLAGPLCTVFVLESRRVCGFGVWDLPIIFNGFINQKVSE